MTSQTLHGVIDGNTIHLQQPSSLPTGPAVRVIVYAEPAGTAPPLVPGEGLTRAFGTWSDYAAELDKFNDENRQARKVDRQELAE